MAMILLVDDDEKVTTSLRRRLATAGHDVEVADGETVIREGFVASRFDFIILDVEMPVHDGADVFQFLFPEKGTETDPRPAVIVATGVPQSQKALWLKGQPRVRGILEKPYLYEELEKLMNPSFSTGNVPVRAGRPTMNAIEETGCIKRDPLDVVLHDLRNSVAAVILNLEIVADPKYSSGPALEAARDALDEAMNLRKNLSKIKQAAEFSS